jgi:hypothetical protein
MKSMRKVLTSVGAAVVVLASVISVSAATYYDRHDYGTKTSNNLKAERTGEYYVSSNDYIIGRLKVCSTDNSKRYSYGRVYFKYKNFWGNWKTDDETDTGKIYKYVTKSTVNEVTACENLGYYSECPDTWTSNYKACFSFGKA